ncbi:MAG TPA: biotin/lipoyl-containing protein [Pyrinomonadaceae bacterium]|jgi:biotin carboxyl carrier protein|nr:biotin/lipoyl-containing protein [Pyrinomonadaceae bacterium]
MKLRAELSGENHQLSVVRGEGGRVLAEIDGRRYELQARETEAGVYLLLVGGRVYECRVEGAGAYGAGASKVEVGGRAYEVTLIDPRRLRGTRSAAGHDGGRAEVAAPMPGKVVRVLVEEGAEVGAGEGLVVVEAMKMQNELKSPKAGRVSSLRARVGATVNAGEVLVVLE